MYKVKFYKGDYRERQEAANKDGCVAYVEHHFNSVPEPSANYTVVVTGANASRTSINWGRWYASAVSREFNVPVGGDQGVMVGGFNGRGDANLKYTNMPAVLLEPLFASNPAHAEWIRGEDGQARLARILCESVERFFPNGGLIGLSVGHKYKTSKPADRGAAVAGGGTEADCAEKVLEAAARLIEGVTAPAAAREIKVVQGGVVAWSVAIDADAEVRWDPVRGTLTIPGGR